MPRPYASTGYYNRDPAQAREYSVATDGDRMLSLNFRVREFAQDGTDRLLVHPAIPAGLQRLRTRFGQGDIESAFRTAGHNDDVGGADDSFHLLGMAVDVRFPHYGDSVGVASYARDVLGFVVGLRPSGALHLSVGDEGGADRTIVEPGKYVQFPNLFPDGRDRTSYFASTEPKIMGAGHVQIAEAGGGLVGALAVGMLVAAFVRSPDAPPPVRRLVGRLTTR